MTVENWGGYRYGRGRGSKGTHWPTRSEHVPNDQLRQLLAASARNHARQAVRLFVSDDQDKCLQAAVSVGCAIELLAKTFLVSVEPTLLADRGQRDAVLTLSGHGHLVEVSPTDIKTISAQDVMTMTKHLYTAFAYNPTADQVVLKVRNAAAHMALVDRTELRAAVVIMCRAIDSLLPKLDLDRVTFWGVLELPAVDILIDDAKSRVKGVVAAKVATANQTFADLTKGLDPASVVVVLRSLSGRHVHYSDHEEPQQCPVCEQQGWLLCGVERGEPQMHMDSEGVVALSADRTAYPFCFECPVCELDLESDELVEFDFSTEIELEPVDDPFDEWEPDYDDLRGR